MKDILKTVVISALVFVVAVLFGVPPRIAQLIASFDAGHADWDSTFETSMPLGTDSVSLGDDHIRQLKAFIRNRAEVEHDWSDGTVGEAGQNDTGRHLIGSARGFLQNGAPTAITATDTAASTALDAGRIWFDQNLGNRLQVFDAAFEDVWALPTGAIILWDSTGSAGDEDCNGVLDAGCPCGFTEQTAFRNLKAVGADTGLGDANIPDTPGISCTAAVQPAGCGGTAPQYDNVPHDSTMSGHIHTIDIDSGVGTGDDVAEGETAPGTNTDDTSNTGGDLPHYHEIRTVLFCKAS